MLEDLDPVARYAQSLGFTIRPRTILVEGTTDVDLFHLTARLEREATGVDLLSPDVAIIAGGAGELGGTQGVIRELVCFRGFARTCLSPGGGPRYRFVGLFDDDRAGKQAVRAARDFDTGILEYKDVFRLRPVMPLSSNLDPTSLQKTFEKENEPYKGLDWEIEDLLPDAFVDSLLADYPDAVFPHCFSRGQGASGFLRAMVKRGFIATFNRMQFEPTSPP